MNAPGSMVERVARALATLDYSERFRDLHGNEEHIRRNVDANWQVFTAKARAAIEAMREPDLAMRKVCCFKTAEIEYPAMIDAALKEGE